MAYRSRNTHSRTIPLAIFAVLLLGAYIGGILFIGTKKEAVAVRTTELANEIHREESMRNVAALLDDVSEEKQKLDDFFLDPSEAVEFIEFVEGLSEGTGASVSITDVSVDDADSDTGEGTLVVLVIGQGSWSAVSHLVALLDSLPYAGTLTSFTLTLTGEAEGESQWALRGTLELPLRI